MRDNVLDYVKCTTTGKDRKKDILILEEINILADTAIESKEVRRAFLYSYLTGLWWVDVKHLKWRNITLATCQIDLEQSKTGENVILNSAAIQLLGKPGKTC